MSNARGDGSPHQKRRRGSAFLPADRGKALVRRRTGMDENLGYLSRPDRSDVTTEPNYSLFVQQRFPVSRHRSGWSWHRLIQGMTVRSVKLRAGDKVFYTVVVKPLLARLEAHDYRVAGSGGVFRCMLLR